MSFQRREALIEKIVNVQPPFRELVRDFSSDLTAGSWDLVSYSFQQGFEALWDLARADHTGLLERPLLALWRQSVELAIKSAVLELAGCIDGKPGHDLQALFKLLLEIRVSEGCCDNDDLTQTVQMMISQIQSFDPFADRFRYPTDKNGRLYAGVSVDLDELFQAHWIIITWCEGAVMELRGDY
ncbi:MAG: hypothetical protein V7676_14900 [Parasphingorhabdus sp.]|uniref:hypothetical protein n=1 Tax=Parasphingorhabdus sp. TaxID=2709688 RepID=UPI003002BFEE